MEGVLLCVLVECSPPTTLILLYGMVSGLL